MAHGYARKPFAPGKHSVAGDMLMYEYMLMHTNS